MTRRPPFRWALSAVCLALLCAAGCRTEPVSWRTSLHDVILFGDSLGWSELVPDTLWTQGEEGLVLEVRDRRALLDADALKLKTPTTQRTT